MPVACGHFQASMTLQVTAEMVPGLVLSPEGDLLLKEHKEPDLTACQKAEYHPGNARSPC